MKGIVLAGGRGSRLYPITLSTCKQLLPIYDKPLIYYPISTLMYAGVREMLIITTPHDLGRFQELLGDGSQFGLSFEYEVQHAPRGIAESLIIGENYIGDDRIALVLGDNIFYGHHLQKMLMDCSAKDKGAQVFGYEVHDPERYGVADFDNEGNVKAIIEKPKIPPSPYAITGLYFYDNRAIEMAKKLKPSWRGELEITDITQAYLEMGECYVHLLDRGFAWLDTGTTLDMHKASVYVQTIQERQGICIACLEEIAFELGLISQETLFKHAEKAGESAYGDYLCGAAMRSKPEHALTNGMLRGPIQ